MAKIYNEELKNSYHVPEIPQDSTSVWAQYTLQSNKRDRIISFLKENNIPAMIYYPKPMHEQPAYKKFTLNKDLNESSKLSESVFSIPIHPYLTDLEIEYIIENLKRQKIYIYKIMKKRKVLGILPSYSAGGAEKIMLAYFHSIEKRPFFLKLFVVNKIGPLKTKLANTFECEYKRFIYCIPKLLYYIKKNKFSIIYSTFPHITIALIITKFFKLHNCKVIVRQPNMLYDSLNNSLKLRIIRFIYLRVINFCDAIIVTSQAMQKEALKYKFNKEKIHLLPNPINISSIRSKVIPERNNKSLIKLVFVGRLSYQKGLDRVLNLFSNIKNIEFIIIGEGPQRKKLEDFVKKNKLQKKNYFFMGLFLDHTISLQAQIIFCFHQGGKECQIAFLRL